MIHLGDITKISGYEIPIVDVITGGSPCQDLSVAGKRAGLDGERSGLFMEQIRIVKEMRERDRRENGRSGQFVRPRFMVWENVPGAFSSNKGQDFQAVLTEIVRIEEPDAPDVPMPDKGKWTKSGCLYDEMGRWSVAWRVHDAQFWGVPQRRKRIALVADFGGLCAPEVLFVRKGLSRDSAESGTKGEGTSTGTEEGIGETGGAIGFPLGFRPENVRTYEETATTLCNGTRPGFTCGVIATQPTYCLQGNGIDRADTAGCNGRGWTEDVSYTLNTIDRPAVMAAGFDPQMGAKACGIGYEDGLSPTLNAGKIMGVNIYDSSK